MSDKFENHNLVVLQDMEDRGTFALASAQKTNDAGQPVQRFSKELISIGDYSHPIHGWKLRVIEKRMDGWVKAFQAMRTNGIDIEVVKDHSLKADDVVGYLVDMYRDGNRLIGVHEMVGTDSIELAGRVKNVSVLIERAYKDGKGREYGEAITHSSIVQQPVVPNQEGFLPIAASRAGCADIQSVFLQKATIDKENIMNEEQLKKLRKLLGLNDDDKLDDKNFIEVLGKKLSTLSEQADKVEALEAQIKELSKKPPKKKDDDKMEIMHPDMAAQAAEMGKEKLDMLVEKSIVTPAVRDKLAASLIGEGENINVYALSITNQPDRKSLLNQVVDALKENDPVKLGEQTKSQALTLSRVIPGGEDESTAEEQEKLGRDAGKTAVAGMK